MEDSATHRFWNLTLLEIFSSVLRAETPAKLLATPPDGAPPLTPPGTTAAPATAAAAAAATKAGGGKQRAVQRAPSELGTLLEQKRMRKVPLEGSSMRHSRFTGAFQVRLPYAHMHMHMPPRRAPDDSVAF